MERVGGTLFFKIDGTQFSAKGNFTYNLGLPKREAIVGADGVHGVKEMPQAPRISGEITDSSNLSMETFVQIKNATLTLELANGKVFVMREAWYTADGDAQTEEGNIQCEFTGKSAEEIR